MICMLCVAFGLLDLSLSCSSWVGSYYKPIRIVRTIDLRPHHQGDRRWVTPLSVSVQA